MTDLIRGAFAMYQNQNSGNRSSVPMRREKPGAAGVGLGIGSIERDGLGRIASVFSLSAFGAQQPMVWIREQVFRPQRQVLRFAMAQAVAPFLMQVLPQYGQRRIKVEYSKMGRGEKRCRPQFRKRGRRMIRGDQDGGTVQPLLPQSIQHRLGVQKRCAGYHGEGDATVHKASAQDNQIAQPFQDQRVLPH